MDKKIKCCGCHACYNICPEKCIYMRSDDEGFWYPIRDIKKCSECGLCQKVCPILRNNNLETYIAKAYAGINKDESIRWQSSSGGLFSIIAEKIIANNGVVFGATFDDDFNVLHSWTESLSGVATFRGSKYVQSYIGDTYKQARAFLQQGRQVLFSGTPCQIAGLRSYLDQEYQGLICLDIICHGVPSPLVWKKYLDTVVGGGIQAINFRDKTFGWKNFSLKLNYSNGHVYLKNLNIDPFLQGFLKNVYLRPTCYNCHFKKTNRQSDFTLADFWGIEKIIPGFDDDRGTSLIFVNSQKGEKIFLSVVDKISYEQVNIDQAILYNPSAVKSVAYNSKRKKFFQELSGLVEINKLIIKYTKIRFSMKLYLKLRLIFSCIKRKIFLKC